MKRTFVSVVFVLSLGVVLSGCVGAYGGIYVGGEPVVVVRPHPTVVVARPVITVRPQCDGKLIMKKAEEPNPSIPGVIDRVPARDAAGNIIHECHGQVRYYPDVRYSY